MTAPEETSREPRSRLLKLLRRWLRHHPGLRSKHGASLALDILSENGIAEVAVRRQDGRLVHLATDDKVIAPGVIRHGTFSPEIMASFAALLRQSGIDPAELTFVNVGANIGTACLNAYDAGFRRLVAIEPEPRNFRLLSLNLAELPGAEVRLIEAAVGAIKSRLALHRHARNMGAHSLVATSHASPGDDQIEVAVEPLASLIEAEVPFALFVDVEGFEPQVLRGAAGLLQKSCRALALEITPNKYTPAEADDLARRIADFGGNISLLPSGTRQPAASLPRLMAEKRQGHFDIAVVRGSAA